MFFALVSQFFCTAEIKSLYRYSLYNTEISRKNRSGWCAVFPSKQKGCQNSEPNTGTTFHHPRKAKTFTSFWNTSALNWFGSGHYLYESFRHWKHLCSQPPLFKRSDCHRLSNSFTEKNVACGGSQWRKQCSHKRSKWCTTKQHQHHGFRDEVPRRMEKLPHWSCKVWLESWSLLAASNMSMTLTWTAKNIRNKTYELYISIYIYFLPSYIHYTSPICTILLLIQMNLDFQKLCSNWRGIQFDGSVGSFRSYWIRILLVLKPAGGGNTTTGMANTTLPLYSLLLHSPLPSYSALLFKSPYIGSFSTTLNW